MGTSHLSSPKVIVKIFREMFKLYPEMRKRVPRASEEQARSRVLEA
jgi:hypothetical protein